jgi:hypothetical protein
MGCGLPQLGRSRRVRGVDALLPGVGEQGSRGANGSGQPELGQSPERRRQMRSEVRHQPGTSRTSALKVAADEATTDSPRTIFRCLFMDSSDMLLLLVRVRREQVAQLDSAQKFRANTLSHGVHYLAAIVGWVDVHAERPAAERRVDHVDNRARHA